MHGLRLGLAPGGAVGQSTLATFLARPEWSAEMRGLALLGAVGLAWLGVPPPAQGPAPRLRGQAPGAGVPPARAAKSAGALEQALMAEQCNPSKCPRCFRNAKDSSGTP